MDKIKQQNEVKIKKIPQVKCGFCGIKSEKPLMIQLPSKKYCHILTCYDEFLVEKELQRIENEQWSDLFEYLKKLHDVPTLPPRNIKRLHELRRGNDIKEGKVYLRYKQGATFDLLLDAYKVAESKIKWFIHDVLQDNFGAEDINKCITLMLNDGLNQAWQNRKQKKKEEEAALKLSLTESYSDRSIDSEPTYKKKKDTNDISNLL